jgi:hypothetical protein
MVATVQHVFRPVITGSRWSPVVPPLLSPVVTTAELAR